MSSCSSSSALEPETCDLTENEQVMDEMAFIVGTLREIVHILGTETDPDYSAISSETSDLLEKANDIQAPSCLEKAKGLLVSTIESTMVGIEYFQSGESEKAIKYINEKTNEILMQYIQELMTVMSTEEGN